jgi:hypothetical protein
VDDHLNGFRLDLENNRNMHLGEHGKTMVSYSKWRCFHGGNDTFVGMPWLRYRQLLVFQQGFMNRLPRRDLAWELQMPLMTLM